MSLPVISVSSLVDLLKDLIEENFVEVFVEGEISNFSKPGSGHCYFTLKDDRGQLRCAMFRSHSRLLKFIPENGMQVICRGRASVYPQRGELQLIVESVEPSGIGGMQLAFEQLKQKLAAEGLFAQERKKVLPEFPQIIGVVTSATGAAIHDILNTLRRRSSGVRVLLRPVRVQGAGAAAEIAEAIADLNQEGSADVLIIGRGGGSLEDLWAFSEEVVARAISASILPVVSAVGHEVDFSIADLVADLRAPTPTAAAEMVVKNREEVESHCDQLLMRLGRIMQGRLSLMRLRFDGLTRRLVSPVDTLHQRRRQLDEFEQRFKRSILLRMQQSGQMLQSLVERLDALSPLRVLARGYALARLQPMGTPLLHVDQVQVGDQISVQLAQGELEASVLGISFEKKPKLT
ncbi:exodeoxyribonuclease VII large subunit [Geopsychrobacter electrodiphilus]|uniref:exodeoxyribonuclease VII large subunit n=1 Tax=Geopsychrobacter electrodiphilus TaxID=225196 RepID=UPI00036FFF52|nr:exodeoxyribonuclease VII large subunit [Geopsychrobacter electrodiphilus]